MQDEKSASYYRAKFIKTLVIVFLIGGLFFLKGPIEDMLSGKKSKPAVEVASEKERKIKYWVAPMNPKFRSDKPGKSPMGMDLVPVYEDDGGGGVKIDPTAMQNIGVRTAVVERRNLARDIKVAGLITYDERKVVKVQSKTKGWVEKLYVDFTGKQVEKGDYLLELYSPELVATSEEFIIALDYYDAMLKSSLGKMRNSGRTLVEASRRRLEFFDVPEHQIKELEKTRKVKKTLHIHSPVKGVVVTKNVDRGTEVTLGKVLYVIADLSPIWVLADIYEYEIPWVKEGQKVTMSLASIPNTIFEGRVTYIYPYLEIKTRTVQVRMEFENLDLLLKPDMYADVNIEADVRESAIAIPKEAVLRAGKKSMTLVEISEGRFEPREVRLGVDSEDYYEVLDGLEEGETVVVSGNFLIDSESNLKEVFGRMLSYDKAKEIKPKMMEGMKHEGMKMDHGDMDMEGMKHEGMKMDHGDMDMEGMKHEGMKMDHGDMKHGGENEQ